MRVFILALILIFLFWQPNVCMNDEVTPLSMALKHSSMPCMKLLVQISCLLHSDYNRISLTNVGWVKLCNYVCVSHRFMEKVYDCFVFLNYFCRLELI